MVLNRFTKDKYIISANPLTVTTYELRYDSAAFIVQKEFQLNAVINITVNS